MWRSMTPVPPEVLIQYSTTDQSDGPADAPASYIEPLYAVLHSPNLRAAIHIMQIAAQMVDLQTACSPTAPPRSVMVHTRNMAQHQLLMLYDGPDHSQAPWRLQGTTKLEGLDAVAHPAALLFCDLVLIPLPPTSGTRQRLLRELLSAVCAVSFRPQQMAAPAIRQPSPPATIIGSMTSTQQAPGHSSTSSLPATTHLPSNTTSLSEDPSGHSQNATLPTFPPSTPSASLHEHIHLWAIIILAIGSLTHHPCTPSESALVAEIDNYCLSYLSTQNVLSPEPGEESWIGLKKLMKQFLWWDYVLEGPGRDIWRRVAALKAAGRD